MAVKEVIFPTGHMEIEEFLLWPKSIHERNFSLIETEISYFSRHQRNSLQPNMAGWMNWSSIPIIYVFPRIGRQFPAKIDLDFLCQSLV